MSSLGQARIDCRLSLSAASFLLGLLPRIYFVLYLFSSADGRLRLRRIYRIFRCHDARETLVAHPGPRPPRFSCSYESSL